MAPNAHTHNRMCELQSVLQPKFPLNNWNFQFSRHCCFAFTRAATQKSDSNWKMDFNASLIIFFSNAIGNRVKYWELHFPASVRGQSTSIVVKWTIASDPLCVEVLPLCTRKPLFVYEMSNSMLFFGCVVRNSLKCWEASRQRVTREWGAQT